MELTCNKQKRSLESLKEDSNTKIRDIRAQLDSFETGLLDSFEQELIPKVGRDTKIAIEEHQERLREEFNKRISEDFKDKERRLMYLEG